MSNKHEVTPFNYNGHNLSTITYSAGEVWFVAKYVAEILHSENGSPSSISRPENLMARGNLLQPHRKTSTEEASCWKKARSFLY